MVLLLLCLASLSACATSAALRRGRQAERVEDYDRAVLEYTRAVRRDSDNRGAQLALDRAKLQAAQRHYT